MLIKKIWLNSIVFADDKLLLFSWSVVMMEEIQGSKVPYWCFLIHSRNRKEETGDAGVITSMHRVLSIFSVSKYSFVCILLYFFIILFTPVFEKRWSKPARLASFRTLCRCQEKMPWICTDAKQGGKGWLVS